MIQKAIQSLINDGQLSAEDARAAALSILDGEATQAQIGAFLAALRLRGESAEHIHAFATVMREKAARLRKPDGVVLDTCGTGGDHSGTFNISTGAAFVAAGAGVIVAKHGNRAATSLCGSADVLEALGVKVDLDADGAQRCLDECGVCFMFAQKHHGAMRHVAGPRKELGVRTIFNLLGPLSNPAGASHQLIGIFDGALTEIYARALGRLGAERALVVHGEDGLDELTTTAATRITELLPGGAIATREFTPEEAGLKRAAAEDLRGGDAAFNAAILRAILSNEDHGPKADIVALNAGAALYVTGKAATIAAGVSQAREIIATGKAIEKLRMLAKVSNR